MTLLVCFRRVFPTHVHFLLAIPFQMLCWTVLPRFVCLWVFCHLLFRMYLRHILMNVCSTRLLSWLLSMSQIQIAVHLKIQILFRVEKDDVFHTVFKMLNAYLAFPILFFYIYICSSFVRHYTSQIGEFVVLLYIYFPFSCTLAGCVLFTFSSFVFCMFIFKPVFSASCVNLLDLFCICLCVCDSRQMSAKSRSSNCLVNVHRMPFWPC